jgi:polysaccharide deacetylase 2 family uncharacterized protein YibQ
MANSPRRPLPGRIWGILAAMVLAALLCLMLALLLGTRLRSMGPERGGGREGYMQVVKPTDNPAAQMQTDAAAEAQLEVMMDKPGVHVTGTAVVTSVTTVSQTEAAPMEMPMLEMRPTEVPPQPAGRAPVAMPQTDVTPLTVVEMPEYPRWKKNAVTVEMTPGAPMLAIVIDDMGDQMGEAFNGSQRAVDELPNGVTLSFFPWSKPGVALAHEARDKGHEIMIHMPMEALPHGDTVLDPGPDALRVGMPADEIETKLRRNVNNLSDIAVGLNNHMGSRFTEWMPGLRAVLTVLQGEGMLFLDSKTAAPTATKEASAGLTLPILSRDVFLDHVPTPEAVKAELNKAVLLARKRGSAIAIGHPMPVTLDVLRDMLPQVVSSGIVLVPVSMLVK